jgi:hypothetical protein
MEWAEHVAGIKERRGAYRVLVEKSGGQRPLCKPRSRSEICVKMDLQKFGSRYELY